MTIQLQVDLNDFKRFKKTVADLPASAMRIVKENVVNDMAFNTSQGSKKWMRDNWTMRSPFTMKKLIVEKAGKGETQSRMLVAVPDRSQPFLEKQHKGGHWPGQGKFGRAIPTDDARNGQNPDKKVKRRLLLGRLPRMQTIRDHRGRHARKKVVGGFADLANKGEKFAFRRHQGGGGIYQLKKQGRGKAPKITKIYNVAKEGTTVKRTPWLDKGFDNMETKFPKSVRKHMNFQFRYHFRKHRK